jgi:hypothetical protein
MSRVNIWVNTDDDLYCPGCEHLINASMSADIRAREKPPKPGDFSICSYCGTISVFTMTGLRLANQEEKNKAIFDIEKNIGVNFGNDTVH